MPVEAGWRPGKRVVERSAVRERTPPIPDRSRGWTLLAIVIIIVISVGRVPHLGFPLERDEGEFGYIAQQLLHGVPVYESGYTQKLPGTYYVYALCLALFGQSTVAIHLGLLLVNAAIMGLIFLTLRRTHGGLAGVVGALTFGSMALSPTVLGFAAHATFFVALFSTAGLYWFLLARDRGSLLLHLGSGLCFGLAFLMKQQAVFFAPLMLGFMVAHALAQSKRPAGWVRHASAFLAGSLLPILSIAAYYVVIGRFALFWYWSVQFASEFVGLVGLGDGLMMSYDGTAFVMSGFKVLWAMALVGFVVLCRDAVLGKGGYPYLAFGLAALLSIIPGFYFASHYYVSLLPFVALLIGSLVAATRGWVRAAVGTALAVGLLVGFGRYEPYFTGRAPDEVVARAVLAGNAFPESVEIGRYLERNTSPRDSVAILGSETQIYFYARRPSASRFLNVYFLTAEQPRNRDMQLEMIRDIERVRPKYLIYVHIPFSWSMRGKSPRDILAWYEGYKLNYQVEGVVQMQSNRSVTTWGPDARAVEPTRSYIQILRRIDEAPAGG